MTDVALSTAIESYSHALSKALSTCRHLHDVLQLLTAAVGTLLDGGTGPDADGVKGSLEGHASLLEHWQQLQGLASGHGEWQRVKHLFYGRPFQELGEVLLSGGWEFKNFSIRSRFFSCMVEGSIAFFYQNRSCFANPPTAVLPSRK
jgi:hypothetical protein